MLFCSWPTEIVWDIGSIGHLCLGLLVGLGCPLRLCLTPVRPRHLAGQLDQLGQQHQVYHQRHLVQPGRHRLPGLACLLDQRVLWCHSRHLGPALLWVHLYQGYLVFRPVPVDQRRLANHLCRWRHYCLELLWVPETHKRKCAPGKMRRRLLNSQLVLLVQLILGVLWVLLGNFGSQCSLVLVVQSRHHGHLCCPVCLQIPVH